MFKFLNTVSFVCLLTFAVNAQEVSVLGNETIAESSMEELGGFGAIFGAYDVTNTAVEVGENAQPQMDMLLPFLQQKEARDLLEDAPYTGKFSLLNRRTDRKEIFEISPSKNVHEIEKDKLFIEIHQCVKNADDRNDNDIAFVEITEYLEDESAVSLFSGWLYSQFPSANQFEHSVYNLKLKSCQKEDKFYGKFPAMEDVTPTVDVEAVDVQKDMSDLGTTSF